MLLFVLIWLLALFAIVAAWVLGGTIERRGAQIMVAMAAVGFGGRLMSGSVFNAIDLVATAQDLLAFLGFSVLGIYSKRVWPLWAAAFQLLSVGAHLVRALELEVRPIVYAWMKSGPTWAVLLLLIIGTAGHQWRMRRDASNRYSPG